MPFSVHTDLVGRHCRIEASGEIDLALAEDFVAAGKSGLGGPEVESVVIDMGGVTFMDSTGLSALVQIRNEALRLDKSIALERVPRQVRLILTITGLDEAFCLQVPSVDGADGNLG